MFDRKDIGRSLNFPTQLKNFFHWNPQALTEHWWIQDSGWGYIFMYFRNGDSNRVDTSCILGADCGFISLAGQWSRLCEQILFCSRKLALFFSVIVLLVFTVVPVQINSCIFQNGTRKINESWEKPFYFQYAYFIRYFN